MKRLGTLTTAILAITALAYQASGASATGRINFRVLRVLAIQALTDMTFAPASAGAPESTISATDTKQSGSFVVQGEAASTYTIKLPSEVTISIGRGGKDETIVVRNFTSSPTGSGLITGDGSQTLYVGATRAALSNKQRDGVYVGAYTVEVIY